MLPPNQSPVSLALTAFVLLSFQSGSMALIFICAGLLAMALFFDAICKLLGLLRDVASEN